MPDFSASAANCHPSFCLWIKVPLPASLLRNGTERHQFLQQRQGRSRNLWKSRRSVSTIFNALTLSRLFVMEKFCDLTKRSAHADVRHGPVSLRLVHLQPLHQPTILLRRQLPRFVFAAWPLIYTLLQPLIQQQEAVTFPVQRLDAVTPPAAEQKQCVCERIQPELLLHEPRETVDAAAEIRIIRELG